MFDINIAEYNLFRGINNFVKAVCHFSLVLKLIDDLID